LYAGVRLLQRVHLDGLLLDEHLLVLGALPAGHLRECVLVLLAARIELGELGEFRSLGHRYGGATAKASMHRFL
jgi:hypothetical protein